MSDYIAPTSRIVILVDKKRVSAFSEPTLLAGWDLQFLEGKLQRAGFLPSEVSFLSLEAGPIETLRLLNESKPNVIVTLDEEPLRFVTGKRSLSKWHLSPLDCLPEFHTRKCIPTFHPDSVKKQWELGFYVERALLRARREFHSVEFTRKPKRFHLNPRLAEVLELLDYAAKQPILALDIETGRGQINTFGVAWSPSDALAVNTLPGNYGAENFTLLWRKIGALCEGPAKKILQNASYENSYLGRYGISLRGIWHDTMVAQKFLYPEFEKGLDNVGRLYTEEPYWKDTGKESATGEGTKRDWANVRDWPKHYLYNALDTSGSFEAALSQREDLQARGKLELFDSYVMQLYVPVCEMNLRGLPVSAEKKAKLEGEARTELDSLRAKLPPTLNPRSPKQKLEFFRAKGYNIPKVRGGETGFFRETVNELSLKKMRLKHPEDSDINTLLGIAKIEKSLSSYLGVEVPPDGFVRYMLGIFGTETGRMTCTTDHLGMGFNAQTIPSYAKKMIEWPAESERVFLQVDLKQAESRFVAYDCADETLIRMLEDPNEDVHSYVAQEICRTLSVNTVGISKEEWKKKWRQLGKKSGHGANYAMAEGTFMESCLKEMNLVLSKTEAKGILEAYHRLFPGIRRGHQWVRETVRRERKLSNPIGLERYFYGRMDDNTFREAYAYRPQSTIPAVTNFLMLALCRKREEGAFSFFFHNQVHDSLVLSCAPGEVPRIANFMLDTSAWHPKIQLRAGRLVIPTEVEFGANLGNLKTYEPKQTQQDNTTKEPQHEESRA